MRLNWRAINVCRFRHLASSHKTPRVHTFRSFGTCGRTHRMAMTFTARGMWYCMWTSCESVPFAPSRECCRQPNGRSLLPSQSDRASIVGHARTLQIIVLPSGGLWARPRRANSNRCREKHTASIAITHRVSGRSARRNKALIPSSTLPSLSDDDLLADVTFCHTQKPGSLAQNDKTRQILHSTSSVGPMFAKQLTFRTTYTYTCT
jgi:hypothetical protein